MTTALVRYEQARTALAECHRVDEVKDIRDKAEAMAAYARLAKDSQLILWATEIKVRAERKAGEMLAQMPKSTGAKFNGRAPDGSFRQSHDDSAQTLADIGVTPMQSSRWQKLAHISDEVFEGAIATAKETAGEVTTAHLLREAEKSRPYRPTRKLSKKDKEGNAEIERLRAIGVSLLTSYARPLLAMLRSQATFTDAERTLLAELSEAIHHVSETA